MPRWHSQMLGLNLCRHLLGRIRKSLPLCLQRIHNQECFVSICERVAVSEMSEQNRIVVLEQHQFCCPTVCLDLLKEPVSLSCGHNNCSDCIEDFWDHNEEKGEYSCPQCRATFSWRPTLNRNIHC